MTNEQKTQERSLQSLYNGENFPVDPNFKVSTGGEQLTQDEKKAAKLFNMGGDEYRSWEGNYKKTKTQKEVNEMLGITPEEYEKFKDPEYRPEIVEIDGKVPEGTLGEFEEVIPMGVDPYLKDEGEED